MKRKALVSIPLSALILAGCGSPNAPAEFEKLGHAEKWINEVGYECASWQENTDTHALCRLQGGGSITISLNDDPVAALPNYFESGTFVGAAVGGNWFSVCTAEEMGQCGDLASGAGVKYVPNPIYVN